MDREVAKPPDIQTEGDLTIVPGRQAPGSQPPGEARDERARTDVESDREEVVPIVQETLAVGDVSRGSVGVRSYVSATPVHEQVRLRDERVDVERRRVDQPLSAADDDPLRERTIDMTAMGEEAVVSKEARVVEEVVVSKIAGEHVETIDDTVRNTEVDIDRDGDAGRGAMSGR